MQLRYDITIGRVYDPPDTPNRARLLVDRLWPRGIAKADLALDDWLKDSAPSHELRRWFHVDPTRWPEFVSRYCAELDARPDAVAVALDWCERGPIALLTAAKDRDHNHALVLRDYLTEHLTAAGNS